VDRPERGKIWGEEESASCYEGDIAIKVGMMLQKKQN
jgi:hypothetical protein